MKHKTSKIVDYFCVEFPKFNLLIIGTPNNTKTNL